MGIAKNDDSKKIGKGQIIHCVYRLLSFTRLARASKLRTMAELVMELQVKDTKLVCHLD